jgi:hypothetical protein
MVHVEFKVKQAFALLTVYAIDFYPLSLLKDMIASIKYLL